MNDQPPRSAQPWLRLLFASLKRLSENETTPRFSSFQRKLESSKSSIFNISLDSDFRRNDEFWCHFPILAQTLKQASALRRRITFLLSLTLLCLLTDEGVCQRNSATPPPRFWAILQDQSTDENETIEATRSLREEWPERSLLRRKKNGCEITSRDLSLSPAQLEIISATGAKVVCQSRWLRAVSVEADPAQLGAVRNLPFVDRVIPVQILKRDTVFEEESYDDIANDEMPANEATHLGSYGPSFRQAELARAIEIHRRGGSGRGVLIGVLDTGFQLDHRAFAGLDLIAQFDFINHDADPSYDARTDVKGQANHGTACLSVIGGYDPARLVGIAAKASFALGKTEDTRSETVVEEDYWIEAIEWLGWLGADVVSSSLTYRDWYGRDEFDGRAPISRAAERATELGMVICVSAGNAGPGPITIGAPADAAGVLAVAATDSSGRLTNFSSRGPASDGRIKPDIAAMGRQVVCVKPMTFNEYSRWNGTSLACPIAAGVAALVIEAHPDWPGKKVVEALRMTASQGYMPDDAYGYGLVDAVEAVDYPSLTVLIEEGLKAEFDWIGLQSDQQSLISKPITGNYVRFINLPPGKYRLLVAKGNYFAEGGKVLSTGKSLYIPPSGTLFLKDLHFP